MLDTPLVASDVKKVAEKPNFRDFPKVKYQPLNNLLTSENLCSQNPTKHIYFFANNHSHVLTITPQLTDTDQNYFHLKYQDNEDRLFRSRGRNYIIEVEFWPEDETFKLLDISLDAANNPILNPITNLKKILESPTVSIIKQSLRLLKHQNHPDFTKYFAKLRGKDEYQNITSLMLKLSKFNNHKSYSDSNLNVMEQAQLLKSNHYQEIEKELASFLSFIDSLITSNFNSPVIVEHFLRNITQGINTGLAEIKTRACLKNPTPSQAQALLGKTKK